MTVDKEFITLIIAIVGSTVAVMSKMASKSELKEGNAGLSARIDKLEGRMDAGFNTMNGHLLHVVEASGTHDGRITAIERRIG